MKKLIVILILTPCVLLGQNIEDAYRSHENEHTFDEEITDYYGEYQIFLDKNYWEMENDFTNSAKSMSIEVVSFPFIPEDLLSSDNSTSTHLYNKSTRIFDVQLVDISNVVSLSQSGPLYSYSGYGWQYGNWNIFSRINNTYTCDHGADFMCDGDYGLISAGFVEPITSNNYDDCWLPHTILKHTIYFHCGNQITDDIIDSISWIYDNTRGTMRTYPFSDHNGDDDIPSINVAVDVCYRPSYMNGTIIYDPQVTTSNEDLYDSGVENNTGSVNYFPNDEVIGNNCQNYLLYYNPENPDGSFWQYNQVWPNGETYEASWVHPPVYALIDSPLLNFDGTAWAGYDGTNANPLSGIEHRYEISYEIDLTQINPSEKIIYNPYYVHVNVDITFPQYYKFITLHGKYPDKENEVYYFYNNYWVGKGVGFCYERDYLTPVNGNTNFENVSTYEIKNGKTLTIQPCVIILDAYFKGESSVNKSYIAFDPDYVLGNWDWERETIDTIRLDYSEIGCTWDCTTLKESPFSNGNNSGNEIVESKDYLKIVNYQPDMYLIELDIAPESSSKIIIYNSIGVEMKSFNRNLRQQTFNSTGLPCGIYIVVLYVDGKRIESEKIIL